MLTHVTDHLLNMPIPVEYIEPGSETLAQEYDGLTCGALMEEAAECELEAMYGRRLDSINPFPAGSGVPSVDALAVWKDDLIDDCQDRIITLQAVTTGFAYSLVLADELALARAIG